SYPLARVATKANPPKGGDAKPRGYRPVRTNAQGHAGRAAERTAGGFVLSAPRGFAFILAVIVGAMLVPGCRPSNVSSGASAPAEPVATRLSRNTATVPDQYTGARLNALEAADSSGRDESY